MGKRLAVVFIACGLAACAAAPTGEPYVGVFTGEFVDGLPLYRLPTIEVIGTRRSADKDMSQRERS